MKTIVRNLMHAGGRVSNRGQSVPISPFKFGAKVTLRLKKSRGIMKHYGTLYFDPTANMLTYYPIIKNLKIENDDLVVRKYLIVTTPRTKSGLELFLAY